MEGMPAITGTKMFSALCVRVCLQSDGYIAYAYGNLSKPCYCYLGSEKAQSNQSSIMSVM